VEMQHDLFIPFPKEGSKGIRVIFEHWLEIYREGDLEIQIFGEN
jgi:hypothetical protein